MRIIDAHAHVIERVAGFGKRGELRPLGGGRARWANGDEIQLIPADLGDREFTTEALLGVLDANGIEKAVLLQGGFYGFQNEYSLEAQRAHPGRLLAAGTLDPFCRSRDELVSRLLERERVGAMKFELSVGAGLMSYREAFRIDGPAFAPVVERVAAAGATLVLDVGSPGTESFQPDAIAALAARWPSLRIVVCHLLAPRLGDEEALRKALAPLKRDNVWFDLAAMPSNVAPEGYPYPTARAYLALARGIVGAEKLMWGSDVPNVLTRESYPRLLDFVVSPGLFSPSELDGVLYGNACAAYPALAKGC